MAQSSTQTNLIPVGDFSQARPGGLPAGWAIRAGWPNITPTFKMVKRDGCTVLQAGGNGTDDCFGYVCTPVTLEAGQTYRLYARFRISEGVNPQLHLRFNYQGAAVNGGIFRFRRLGGGWAEGEGRFAAPAEADDNGDVRIYFGFNARGKAWIRNISLTPCEPIAPRPVRLAATGGNVPLKEWRRVLDAAGEEKVDLVLLPETINGHVLESANGPTGLMMARKARQYGMYVAGGLCLKDARAGRVYNVCLLFDRDGKLAGRYDKNHPYTPELTCEVGISAGRTVPVFQTDFGTVGMIICYDSWFTDVTELLALQGAEVILFPNAGYFRGLMPARAADNGVRFVASSLGPWQGIWDTAGRDVTDPDADPTNWARVAPQRTAHHIRKRKIGKVRMLTATMDFSQSPSPHNWGGPCLSAPGGRRNRREQVALLNDRIKAQIERWWDE